MFAAYYRDRAGVAFAHIAIVVLLLIVGIFAHGLLSFIGVVGGIGAAIYFAYRVTQAANVAPPVYTGSSFTSDPSQQPTASPSAPFAPAPQGYAPGTPGYVQNPGYAQNPAYAPPPAAAPNNTMGDLAMGAVAGMALEGMLHRSHETAIPNDTSRIPSTPQGIPVSSVGQDTATMAPISGEQLDRQNSSPWANQSSSDTGSFLPPVEPTDRGQGTDSSFLSPTDAGSSNSGSSFLSPEDSSDLDEPAQSDPEPSSSAGYQSSFAEPETSQDLDRDEPAPTYDAPDSGSSSDSSDWQ